MSHGTGGRKMERDLVSIGLFAYESIGRLLAACKLQSDGWMDGWRRDVSILQEEKEERGGGNLIPDSTSTCE